VQLRSTSGVLLVNPDFSSTGRYTVEWDGADTPAASLNPTGLGGVDLTAIDGQSGVGVGLALPEAQFDQPGGIIRLRVYSDANHWSEASLSAIPPFVQQILFFPFYDSSDPLRFVPRGSEGGVDFANVGAIVLEVEATRQAMDGQLTLIGVLGVDTETVPIRNRVEPPQIDIEKLTNGNRADRPTDSDVPQIPVGAVVTWTFEVTNSGVTDMTQVTVTDNQLGEITNIVARRGGDDDGILEAGETWVYRATGQAAPGLHANTATAEGRTIGGLIARAADPSHYFGAQASIDLEKATNGQDADTAGSGPDVFVGQTVSFSYVVRNTGNVPLSDVRVADDDGTPNNPADDFFATYTSGDSDGDQLLDVDEVWRFSATRIATEGAYANMGVVTARTAAGQEVTDRDPSHHRGIPEPLSSHGPARSKRRFLASYFA
jgi:hypothetical protein